MRHRDSFVIMITPGKRTCNIICTEKDTGLRKTVSFHFFSIKLSQVGQPVVYLPGAYRLAWANQIFITSLEFRRKPFKLA